MERKQSLLGKPIAYFPKMMVGDKWVLEMLPENRLLEGYQDEIIKVNQDGSFVVQTKNKKNEVKWLEYYNNKYQVEKVVYPENNETYFPGKPLIKRLDFPLFVGKKWKNRSTRGCFISKGAVDTYKVISYETVKTKAGEFKAFKIASGLTLNDRALKNLKKLSGITIDDSVWWDRFDWYSPELKTIIKYRNIGPQFGNGEGLLLNYTLGSDE
jgi:hypothetical protein